VSRNTGAVCSYSAVEPDQNLLLSCRFLGGKEPEEEVVTGVSGQGDGSRITLADVEIDIWDRGSINRELWKGILG
jgi:hypothetical protein